MPNDLTLPNPNELPYALRHGVREGLTLCNQALAKTVKSIGTDPEPDVSHAPRLSTLRVHCLLLKSACGLFCVHAEHVASVPRPLSFAQIRLWLRLLAC